MAAGAEHVGLAARVIDSTADGLAVDGDARTLVPAMVPAEAGRGCGKLVGVDRDHDVADAIDAREVMGAIAVPGQAEMPQHPRSEVLDPGMDRLPARGATQGGRGAERQQGRQMVAAPAASAGIVDFGEVLVQASHFGGVHLAHLLGSVKLEFRRQRRGGEPGADIGRERVHQHLFRCRSRDIAVAVAAIAAGPADGDPVGGAVDRAAVALRITEGFQEQQRMMIAGLPVGIDAPRTEAEEAGAQVRLPSAQQQAHIVGNQVQAPEPVAWAPADPVVTRRAFERRGREGGQRRPRAAAVVGRIPYGFADLRSRAEVMMCVQEIAEALFLATCDRYCGQSGKVDHGT